MKSAPTSAPPKVYGFPRALCIGVNDEAIHGIPGQRVLQSGDLVRLHLVAERDGFHADAAVTVARLSPAAASLARCGFHVVRELGGHGIGRAIHKPPCVPTLSIPASAPASPKASSSPNPRRSHLPRHSQNQKCAPPPHISTSPVT